MIAGVNAQYNVAAPNSLPTQIAAYQRRKMYRAFLELGVAPEDTILDVGATSDQTYDHSNYLELWYPHNSRITALGKDKAASFLETACPGVHYVSGDGCSLPFDDRSFDWVHSSAVLEHVGDTARQIAFVREAWRVACKGVFVTTPNRWFPVEIHTVLPLVHWLPKRAFQRLLTKMGRDFFASDANLNLLSAHELRLIAATVGSRNHYVTGVRLGGLISNLLLIMRHDGPSI
jgi:ubiquinone/menaquinone biosynthesis C-methylase UbiE